MPPEYENFNYANPPQAQSPMREIMSRRNITIGLLILAAVVLLIIGWLQFFHKKTITFQAAQGQVITFGTTADDDEGGGMAQVLGKSTTQKSIRVNPGNYTVIYSGTGFASKIEGVKVTSNLILASPHLDYDDSKLSSILSSQQSAIHDAIGKTVNLGDYTFTNEKLYTDGSWYAAQLIPKDASKDVLEVVVQKKDNTWKVVAGPQIILALADYPNVPEVVIRSINNLPWSQ